MASVEVSERLKELGYLTDTHNKKYYKNPNHKPNQKHLSSSSNQAITNKNPQLIENPMFSPLTDLPTPAYNYCFKNTLIEINLAQDIRARTKFTLILNLFVSAVFKPTSHIHAVLFTNSQQLNSKQELFILFNYGIPLVVSAEELSLVTSHTPATESIKEFLDRIGATFKHIPTSNQEEFYSAIHEYTISTLGCSHQDPDGDFESYKLQMRNGRQVFLFKDEVLDIRLLFEEGYKLAVYINEEVSPPTPDSQVGLLEELQWYDSTTYFVNIDQLTVDTLIAYYTTNLDPYTNAPCSEEGEDLLFKIIQNY